MKATDIAFIGAGNMATSLILGLIDKGQKPDGILACDPSPEQHERLAAQLPAGESIRFSADNSAIAGADILVLAVKPQVMAEVARGLKPHLKPGALVISIAAGVPLRALESWLGEQAIVRCMPNTPALVKLGASGLYANERVTEPQRQRAQAILDAVGISVWLTREQDIDAVTAVSGSGPAYFFAFMEAMVEAGEELGLAPYLAKQLAIQTCAGAAELAAKSTDSLAELRRKVTSPGGTTERALDSLRKDDFSEIVRRALHASAARAAELETLLDTSS